MKSLETYTLKISLYSYPLTLQEVGLYFVIETETSIL